MGPDRQRQGGKKGWGAKLGARPLCVSTRANPCPEFRRVSVLLNPHSYCPPSHNEFALEQIQAGYIVYEGNFFPLQILCCQHINTINTWLLPVQHNDIMYTLQRPSSGESLGKNSTLLFHSRWPADSESWSRKEARVTHSFRCTWVLRSMKHSGTLILKNVLSLQAICICQLVPNFNGP